MAVIPPIDPAEGVCAALQGEFSFGPLATIYPTLFHAKYLKTRRFEKTYPTPAGQRDNARMHIQKRHLTRHRRQRYVLWALAMLAWIASVFAGRRITSRQAHQRGDISLQGLTRMVMELVVIRAGELTRIRRRSLAFFKRGRDLRRGHLLRSVVGSRLRRTLKRRDIAAHIANLIAVLRDLDAFARPVAQRLRRGLTRLFPITRIAPSFDTMLRPPAPTPALTDSS
jgi:hypothetical protein